MDAVLTLDTLYHPTAIGMEKAAQQEAAIEFMKEGRLRRIRSKIRAVSTNNKSKELRIRNNVAERFKMKKLFLCSNEPVNYFAQEAKNYRPGPKAKDNCLDAVSMCSVMVRRSVDGDKDEWKTKMQRQGQRHSSQFDSVTGVPL